MLRTPVNLCRVKVESNSEPQRRHRTKPLLPRAAFRICILHKTNIKLDSKHGTQAIFQTSNKPKVLAQAFLLVSCGSSHWK